MSAHPWSHHPIGQVSFAASQGDATIGSMLLIALVVAVGGAGIGLIVVCVRALAARQARPVTGGLPLPRYFPTDSPLIVEGAAPFADPLASPPAPLGEAFPKGATEQIPIVPPLGRKSGVAPTVPMRTPLVRAARTMRTPVGPSRPGVAATLVELGDSPGAEPVVPFELGAARALETERQGRA